MALSRRTTWLSLLVLAFTAGGAMADTTATQPAATTHEVAQALLTMTQSGDYTDFIAHWASACQPDQTPVPSDHACRDTPDKCAAHIPHEERSFLRRGEVIRKNDIAGLVVRKAGEFDSCKLPRNIVALGVDMRHVNGVFSIPPTHYVWVELKDRQFGSRQYLPLGIVQIDDNGWRIVGGSCIVKPPYLSLLKKYCDHDDRR